MHRWNALALSQSSTALKERNALIATTRFSSSAGGHSTDEFGTAANNLSCSSDLQWYITASTIVPACCQLYKDTSFRVVFGTVHVQQPLLVLGAQLIPEGCQQPGHERKVLGTVELQLGICGSCG